ncbi:MAG: septal ring lytic transglycosylase RlpA family protein [Gammaproteobacteria bacterium]
MVTSCASRNPFSPGKDSAPNGHFDASHIQDAVPKHEPRSASGNPASYIVNGKRYYVLKSAKNYRKKGIASWYGKKFHGRSTSSGEKYNMYGMTAAHKNLPLPSYVRVTNLKNKRSIIVKVNDRGPFHANRIIDLSYAAATKLNIISTGTGIVEVRTIDPTDYKKSQQGKSTKSKQTQNTKSNIKNDYIMYLQVGAFISNTNAQQLFNKLTHRFNNVRINSKTTNKQRIYRVQIGPIYSVVEADKLALKVKNMGLDLPHVVIN